MPGQGHLAHMIGACGIRGSSPFRRFHDFKDSVPKIISLPGPSGVLRIFSATGPVRTAFFFYPPQGASIPESMIIIPYFHSLRTVTAGIACGTLSEFRTGFARISIHGIPILPCGDCLQIRRGIRPVRHWLVRR